MNDVFIKEAKRLIVHNNLLALQTLYESYQHYKQCNKYANDEYVYKTILIHAALHNREDIIRWLLGLYDTFDLIVQIALRPTLVYCKYITKCKQIFNERERR